MIMSKRKKNRKRVKKIGNPGKDGDVYLVSDKDKQLALKQFKKSKSSSRIQDEALLQQIASMSGISPKVIGYDLDKKNITMDLLDKSLLDIIVKNDGLIPFRMQKRIIDIFKKLDEIGIFHSDPNPTIFMKKGNTLYIIDYGFAVPINKKVMKKHKTHNPNMKFMVMGLLCRLKELFGKNFRSAYYLESFLSKDDKMLIL